MKKAKFTFEQYCTYLNRNVTLENIIFDDGKRKIVCKDKDCKLNENDCKNKIRKINSVKYWPNAKKIVQYMSIKLYLFL